jgi:hypothetical protein
MRYGELKRAIVGITTKLLTQTLRELEEDELVSRKVYLEVPPKIEYSLTSTGVVLDIVTSVLTKKEQSQTTISMSDVFVVIVICLALESYVGWNHLKGTLINQYQNPKAY